VKLVSEREVKTKSEYIKIVSIINKIGYGYFNIGPAEGVLIHQ
jgi:hypothetical protein